MFEDFSVRMCINTLIYHCSALDSKFNPTNNSYMMWSLLTFIANLWPHLWCLIFLCWLIWECPLVFCCRLTNHWTAVVSTPDTSECQPSASARTLAAAYWLGQQRNMVLLCLIRLLNLPTNSISQLTPKVRQLLVLIYFTTIYFAFYWLSVDLDWKQKWFQSDDRLVHF